MNDIATRKMAPIIELFKTIKWDKKDVVNVKTRPNSLKDSLEETGHEKRFKKMLSVGRELGKRQPFAHFGVRHTEHFGELTDRKRPISF